MEVRFRSDRAQPAFGEIAGGGGVTINTGGGGSGGGAGGGGEKKSEGFGFLGGGQMKDWLIIMIVVVVGVMFLTHSTGIPGQKGPNGGMSLFSAAGNLLGILVKWLTFMANPVVLVIAFGCRYETFRNYFPLGFIDPSWAISAFIKGDDNSDIYSLHIFSYHASKLGELQGTASSIEATNFKYVQAASDDPAIDGAAKDALGAARHLSNVTPELAAAQTSKEFGTALQNLLAMDPSVDTDGRVTAAAALMVQDTDKVVTGSTFQNAWMANKLHGNLEANASYTLATVDQMVEAMKERANDDAIDSLEKMVSFLIQNPLYGQKLNKAANAVVQFAKTPVTGNWLRDNVKNVAKYAFKSVNFWSSSPKRSATGEVYVNTAAISKSMREKFQELESMSAEDIELCISTFRKLTPESFTSTNKMIEDLTRISTSPSMKDIVQKIKSALEVEGSTMSKGFADGIGNAAKEATNAIERALSNPFH